MAKRGPFAGVSFGGGEPDANGTARGNFRMTLPQSGSNAANKSRD